MPAEELELELESGVVDAVLGSEEAVLVSEVDELDSVEAVRSIVSSDCVSFCAHAARAIATAAAMLKKGSLAMRSPLLEEEAGAYARIRYARKPCGSPQCDTTLTRSRFKFREALR